MRISTLLKLKSWAVRQHNLAHRQWRKEDASLFNLYRCRLEERRAFAAKVAAVIDREIASVRAEFHGRRKAAKS